MYAQTIEKLSKEMYDIPEEEAGFIHDMLQSIKKRFKNVSDDFTQEEIDIIKMSSQDPEPGVNWRDL